VTDDHEAIQLTLAGTCIVIIMTATELWVGADSRVVSVGEDVRSAPSVCKLNRFGNVFYVQAGVFKDDAGRCDAAAVAERSASQGHSVVESADAFAKDVIAPLARIAGELRTVNPSYYRSKIINKPALETAFFGVERRAPRLAVRKFIVHETADGLVAVSVQSSNCPGDCPSGMTWAFLGEASTASRFLDRNPQHLRLNGYKATLDKLIGLEATANPEFVRLPVDILRLSQEGPEWIRKKSSCLPVS
jgi:hypothetical protein